MQNHIKSIKLHEIRDKLNVDWSLENLILVIVILEMIEPNGKEISFYFADVERSMRCFSMKLRK